MPTNRSNQRIGLALFTLYLLLYGGFVLLMAFDADQLQVTGPGQVNMAVWSGFSLIVVALILSLVYGWVCRSDGHAEAAGSAEAHEDVVSQEDGA